MDFFDYLASRREKLLEKWQDEFFNTYAKHAAKYYKDQKNRFANPVGTSIQRCTEGIFNAVCEEIDSDKLYEPLEELIRIRNVQEFTPANAVAPLMYLKKIVREDYLESTGSITDIQGILTFETRIDRVLLHAFDLYMKYKVRIYEIRANEASRVSGKLLERLNEAPENENIHTIQTKGGELA